jgi:ankyrin repeat protein
MQYDASLQWLSNENANFQSWLAGDSTVFHITGKPGSGKSMLLGALAPLLRRRRKSDMVAGHFFSKRGGPSEYTFEGLLRSLLHQALCREPSLSHYMSEQWHMAHHQGSDEPEWTLQLLKDAFLSVFVNGSHTLRFYLIIDALDECDGLTSADDIVSFLNTVMQGCKDGSFCFLFSCRQLPNSSLTKSRLSRVQGIRMEEQNREDIENLVEAHWENLASKDSVNEDLRELKTALLKRADGVFLWARLALERVCSAVQSGDSVEEIWETLKEIPDKLSDMFRMFLAKIEKRHREESYRMLAIILAAKRPITLPEFRLIMGLSNSSFVSLRDMDRSKSIVSDSLTMAKRIQSRCGGLLEIKAIGESFPQDGHRAYGSLHTVQFLHQSVKDFLLDWNETANLELPHKDWLLAEGHAHLAKSSLRYLTTAEITSLVPQRIQDTPKTALSIEHPLLEYAIDSWEEHYAEAERLGREQLDLVEHFSGLRAKAFAHWVALYRSLHPAKPLPDDYNLCQFAVRRNISGLVYKLCERDELKIDSRDGSPGAYLCLAVEHGCKEIVQILLDRGVNPNDGGYTGGRPVLFACVEGHADILRLLLKAGAGLGDDLEGYGQHSKIRIIQETGSPLAMAAYSGNEEAIQLILEHDPDTVKQPWLRDYAVLCLVMGAKNAASKLRGDLREAEVLSTVSKLLPLLSVGPELDHGIFSDTLMPILCAATGYSESSLRMFLDMQHRLSPQSLSELFSNVCQHGGVEAVKYLSEACGEETTLQMTVKRDGNLLHAAVRNPETSVLEYLLDFGLDVDYQDFLGWTPLHMAASCASRLHVLMLLERKADCSLRDTQQYTPFHTALRNSTLQYCDELLDRLLEQSGGDAQDPVRDGIQPIHIAAATGRLPVVEWLYSRGADLGAVDDDSRTALHSAASSTEAGATRVIDFLVKKGLDVSHIDHAGMTPLHHVFDAYKEFDAVSYDSDTSLAKVQRLIYHGVDPSAQDGQGSTLLHLAAWHRHINLVELLLKQGVDVSATNCEGQKAIDNTRDEEDVDRNIRHLLILAAKQKSR